MITPCCKPRCPPPAHVLRHLATEARTNGYDVVSGRNKLTVSIAGYGWIEFGLGTGDEWIKILMTCPDPHGRYPNEIENAKAFLEREGRRILDIAVAASGGNVLVCEDGPIWCKFCEVFKFVLY